MTLLFPLVLPTKVGIHFKLISPLTGCPIKLVGAKRRQRRPFGKFPFWGHDTAYLLNYDIYLIYAYPGLPRKSGKGLKLCSHGRFWMCSLLEGFNALNPYRKASQYFSFPAILKGRFRRLRGGQRNLNHHEYRSFFS